ncbi:hypothetical protein [Pedobacter psychrodurus]|uniref:hypothetical protein n=1 Tax=Pedobacter psychrodurus TaxID=2530456 RepID=UPI00292E883A|nr:hypothetical protein [Pedobacter psychrodurus]
MNKLQKLSNYRFHIIFWCLYAILDYTLGVYFTGKPIPFFGALLHYLLNIAFFYLLANWAFPFALNQRRLIPYRFPVIIMVLIIYVAAKFLLDVIFGYHTTVNILESLVSKKIIAGYLFRFLSFAFLAFGSYYQVRYYKEREERYSFMEKQFNAMINPPKEINKEFQLRNDIIERHPDVHFVFSTLSYLFTRLSKKNAVAARIIEGLSELMRYPLKFSDRFASSVLSDEIHQLKTRIEINRLMGKDNHDLLINIPKELMNRLIPAGILMPIMVGIMKTGRSGRPVSLDLILDNESLFISFSNFKIISSSEKFTEDLEWIRERLTEEYGAYAYLEINIREPSDNIFIRIDRFE